MLVMIHPLQTRRTILGIRGGNKILFVKDTLHVQILR